MQDTLESEGDDGKRPFDLAAANGGTEPKAEVTANRSVQMQQ